MQNLSLIELKRTATDFPRVTITGSSSTYDIVRKFWSDDIDVYESMFILLLNKGNKSIGYAKISQGGIAGTVVDPMIVCKYAIDCLASAVIMVHNHPSGNLKPSISDTNITKRVRDVLKLFDINLLDHLIISSDSYYSFADEGVI